MAAATVTEGFLPGLTREALSMLDSRPSVPVSSSLFRTHFTDELSDRAAGPAFRFTAGHADLVWDRLPRGWAVPVLLSTLRGNRAPRRGDAMGVFTRGAMTPGTELKPVAATERWVGAGEGGEGGSGVRPAAGGGFHGQEMGGFPLLFSIWGSGFWSHLPITLLST